MVNGEHPVSELIWKYGIGIGNTDIVSVYVFEKAHVPAVSTAYTVVLVTPFATKLGRGFGSRKVEV